MLGEMLECKFFAQSAIMFVGQEENADACKNGASVRTRLMSNEVQDKICRSVAIEHISDRLSVHCVLS